MRNAALKQDLLHHFVYINYAARWQEPFAGYGKSNVAKIKRVGEKYDPHEVFSRLQPGRFRL